MGMSDWNLREIEDINWDVFAKTNDHLVPYGGGELFDESSSLSHNLKKPRNEVNNNKNECNRYSVAKPVIREDEDTCYYPPLQHTSSSSTLVPSQCDPERSIDGKIMDIRSASNCNPNSIFMESTQKSNNQFDWPDLSSFEDIDKMFGNWDSTLGQERSTTADELSWFSSLNTIPDSEFAFKTGNQSSGSNLVASHNLYESSILNSDLRENVLPIFDLYKPSSSIYAPWSGTDDLTKAKSTYKEKTYDGGEINNAGLKKIKNDSTLIHGGLPSLKLESQQSSKGKRIGESADPTLFNSKIPASNIYSAENTSQQKQFIGSSSCIPNLNPHSEPVFGIPVQQAPYPLTSNVDPKAGINSTSFYNVSDNIPHQLYVPQCLGPMENTHNQSDVKSKCPLEVGNNTEMEDGDTTEKITSFIQLHNAMDQLDVTTKICIRDSLYRLARNADQRHSFTTQNYNVSAMDQKRNQGFKGSKRPAEYMDTETTTNPIDRSIAHLMFHRPLEVPLKSGGCATQFKSHIMNGQAYSLP